MRAAALVVMLAAIAAPAPAEDVILLRNGDRVSGRIVGETAKSLRIQTPYGRLAIPRDRIERVRREGKPEEVLNPPQADAAPTVARRDQTRARLILVVLGKTFWQAWHPKDAPADTALRFEVTVDEETVATYVDATPDPDDIPGTVVNAFSFLAGEVAVHAAEGVEAAAPEARPGRVVLRLDLPGERIGERQVRLAYQANEGSAEAPVWRDMAATTATVTLEDDGPAFVQVRQDPGRMEFSGFPRRKMKNVETFRVEVVAE